MMMTKTSKTTATTAADPRWARIVARDKSADGEFWFSVATTGVYCRPSCPARTANPKNVTIYDSIEAAKSAGFRPCKRCNPDGLSTEAENGALIAKACRMIEESDDEPSLDELADAVELSPSYFHRMFKAATGLTPKAYAVAHRAKKVRQSLSSRCTITEAMYDAGFNSSGRFYEKATDMLGMTPSQYRDGGKDEEIKFAVGQTSLGAILVASSTKGVAAILLGDDPEALVRNLQDRFPKARLVGADPDYEALVAQVVGFVEAPAVGLDLPLDVRGTAFQQRVWRALQEIPVGETVSYTEVAHRIGMPNAVRAVASACATNKLAVAIPCHRVVRNDGALSGYAWGVERKRKLIDGEATRDDLFRGTTLGTRKERMTKDAVLLHGAALPFETELLEALANITTGSPFRHMVTPSGHTMSVAMTNCGAAGWTTSHQGYRYSPTDPLTGTPWPPMPRCFLNLAQSAASEAGYPEFRPDACLINRYEPGARLTLHQDKNERDFSEPIVSVSLGLPAIFQFGGLHRNDPVKKFSLEHGDVAVWGGASRLCFHGVLPLKDGVHDRLGRMRINLTFRRAL